MKSFYVYFVVVVVVHLIFVIRENCIRSTVPEITSLQIIKWIVEGKDENQNNAHMQYLLQHTLALHIFTV